MIFPPETLAYLETIADKSVSSDMFPKVLRRTYPSARRGQNGALVAYEAFHKEGTKAAIVMFMIEMLELGKNPVTALHDAISAENADDKKEKPDQFAERELAARGAPPDPDFSTIVGGPAKEATSHEIKKEETTPRQKRRSKGAAKPDAPAAGNSGQKVQKFTFNGMDCQTIESPLTGQQIKTLTGFSEENHTLMLERGNDDDADVIVQNDRLVEMQGNPIFYTVPPASFGKDKK